MIRDIRVLRPGPGRVVVELFGEHDLETKEPLRDLLASLVARNDLVIVDLSEAEFIDSSVLHNLAIANVLARERGSQFRLQIGSAAIVEKALELSGLLDHLDHVPDREQALRPREAGGAAR